MKKSGKLEIIINTFELDDDYLTMNYNTKYNDLVTMCDCELQTDHAWGGDLKNYEHHLLEEGGAFELILIDAMEQQDGHLFIAS